MVSNDGNSAFIFDGEEPGVVSIDRGGRQDSETISASKGGTLAPSTSIDHIPSLDEFTSYSVTQSHTESTAATLVDYARSLGLLKLSSRGPNIAPDFDAHTMDALTAFSSGLVDQIGQWEELRGVRFSLEVHRFRSAEEKGLELVRLELRVPGAPRSLQFELWERLRHSADIYQRVVSKDLGSTLRGRAFRTVAAGISTAVLPW